MPGVEGPSTSCEAQHHQYDKPGKRAADIDADFLGFSTPDLFVVGYGMDMAHSFRELPYVGVVET